jgi:hypothetical protein
MLLILQDKSADILFEKIGEAAGMVFVVILIIGGIIWLIKKAKQK